MSLIFKQYIQSLLPLPLQKVEEIISIFELIEIPKNELIILENKVSKESYFLEKGLIRSYTYNSNGDEVTTNIFSSPCFANDFLSFFRQTPTSENFQTLTPCRVWKTTFEQVQNSFHTIPEFREFGRMLLVTNYAKLHSRTIDMIKEPAETRYLKLMQQYPEVLQHVPLKYIASYLGITDSSLSRIRKELSHKS
jgi:CRP-like cAMP-binding protein